MSDIMHETTTRDDGGNRSARESVRRARRCVRRGVEKRTLGRAWCGSSSSSNLQRGDSSQIFSREPPQQQMEIDLKACKRLVYTPANDHSNTTPYLLCRCPAATTKFCGRCRPPPGVGWVWWMMKISRVTRQPLPRPCCVRVPTRRERYRCSSPAVLHTVSVSGSRLQD